MYEKILVPLDGSDNSLAALDEAIGLAEKFGSTLHLVSISNDQSYTAYGVPMGEDVMRYAKQHGEGILDQAQTRVKSHGIPVVVHYETGVPKMMISDILPKTYGTTLTVIGKSGVNGVERIILGSTTAYVVRHSTTNVLVVD